MKKTLALFLCAAMILAALCACSGTPAPEADADRAPADVTGRAAATPDAAEPAKFTADNEIFTYEKIDPAKTQLVVSRTGNINIEGIFDAFEAANPDVQLIYIDITGGNSMSHPVQEWLENGRAPDLMFCPTGTFSDEYTEKYFENLSANPVIANYESEALNDAAVNSNIYWLPGSSQVDCMTYNKTLFERYGWEIPATFDEFVALCKQITEDTNGEVEPWNPNAKYSNEFSKAMLGFVYDELFAGLDNRTWYNDFRAGNGTFSGHMEPYYNMLQTLIDNGILKEEHFTYSATTRGKELAAGKIAMVNFPVQHIESDEYEFVYMPFPSTTADCEGYICASLSFTLGVPKKEHTDAEQDAIDRFLAFYSSPEGQTAFIANSYSVSNVKGATSAQMEPLEFVRDAISDGRVFSIISFSSADGKKANFSLVDDAHAMLNGEKTAEECIAAIDAEPYISWDDTPAPEPLAKVTEDFTILETSELMADMYREAAGADIGLIANNSAYRGNLMLLFKGDLNSYDVSAMKPRSFANDSTLIKVSMTGKQLLAAMNDPLVNDGSPDCAYAFSGLKCTVAPWNPLGEKYLSVTLADGSPIDEGKLYTVAFWGGTVKEEYITETLESYAGTWEDLMTAYLTSRPDGAAPAKDGRTTLVWD